MSRFLALDAADRHLIVQAAFLNLAVALGLRLVRFGTLRRWLSPLPTPGADSGANPAVEAITIERIGWAIAASGRRLGRFSTCLTSALAADAMLARRGCPARILIGVDRRRGSPLKAHAWVESRGRIVVGGPVTDQFARLAALEHTGL